MFFSRQVRWGGESQNKTRNITFSLLPLVYIVLVWHFSTFSGMSATFSWSIVTYKWPGIMAAMDPRFCLWDERRGWLCTRATAVKQADSSWSIFVR